MINPRALEILQALAEPTRLRILDLLSSSEEGLTVTLISAYLSVKRTSISHHLGVLHSVGLISFQKSERYHLYKLNWRNNILMSSASDILQTLYVKIKLTEGKE